MALGSDSSRLFEWINGHVITLTPEQWLFVLFALVFLLVVVVMRDRPKPVTVHEIEAQIAPVMVHEINLESDDVQPNLPLLPLEQDASRAAPFGDGVSIH